MFLFIYNGKCFWHEILILPFQLPSPGGDNGTTMEFFLFIFSIFFLLMEFRKSARSSIEGSEIILCDERDFITVYRAESIVKFSYSLNCIHKIKNSSIMSCCSLFFLSSSLYIFLCLGNCIFKFKFCNDGTLLSIAYSVSFPAIIMKIRHFFQFSLSIELIYFSFKVNVRHFNDMHLLNIEGLWIVDLLK